ncbi:MAG: endonuclease domain-containing protein, partial [Actinomycetota bacterium]|nr:endonuclease domain-containing protein [Actinomycetota bacterium]
RHRGVFAVGRADLTRRGELRAALLRCGRGAVLSHRSAAWLHELLGARSRIDITVTGRPDRPGRGSPIVLHYTRRWLPGELAWIDGFPSTSIARTLADLAAAAQRDFTLAWDNADRQVVLDVGTLGQQVARARAGGTVLRERLERHDERPPTESVLEALFVDLCSAHSLGSPVREWPLQGTDRDGRADFVWPGKRVAVEVDGRRWHAVQAAFERDRQKDLELREAGYDPHRYTYRQVRDQAPRVAAAVRRALG